jgi:hypothetical protein
MSEKVKIAVILAVTAIVIMGMYLYFTPYQQCVRAYVDYKTGRGYLTRLETFQQSKMRCNGLELGRME